MLGRREFSALGLSAAAAVLALEAVAHGDDKAKQGDAHDHTMFDQCAQACNDCQRACDSCADHCARMLIEGHKDHHVTLQTCQDCADICSTAAQVVARKGPFSNLICESCADACGKCAAQCQKFKDDKHMAACADECRKCEKACREMLKHGAHAESATSKGR